MNRTVLSITCIALASVTPSLSADDAELVTESKAALKKATHYFRTKVAAGGGYLWRYSLDLEKREGEREATATTVWVQPPGTPSVGLAYLRAFEATQDRDYLNAAREVGMALVRGQLRSGGWDYRIEFDPKQRMRYAYRTEPKGPRRRNVTTLDDDTTQEAVRLLMRLDRALGFKDGPIHECSTFALNALLKAQYPNGAWPQRYSEFPDPAKFPIKKASYPESWSRTYPGKDYRGYYTLNDNTLADAIDVMLEAAKIYKDEKYHKSALRGGEFLLMAQMPDPQPIWAQQYDVDMHPAWARKFEPPSVTGGESQGAMRILLRIYRETGDKKFLAPLPRAIAYFRKVQLSDSRVARFYELKTSKPLYFTKQYKLTYSDADVPTHYGFKTSNRVASIAREFERLSKLDPKELKRPSRPGKLSSTLRNRVKSVIAALDKQGRWVEKGTLRTDDGKREEQMILSSSTFIRNLDVLSDFLLRSRQAK